MAILAWHALAGMLLYWKAASGGYCLPDLLPHPGRTCGRLVINARPANMSMWPSGPSPPRLNAWFNTNTTEVPSVQGCCSTTNMSSTICLMAAQASPDVMQGAKPTVHASDARYEGQTLPLSRPSSTQLMALIAASIRPSTSTDQLSAPQSLHHSSLTARMQHVSYHHHQTSAAIRPEQLICHQACIGSCGHPQTACSLQATRGLT